MISRNYQIAGCDPILDKEKLLMQLDIAIESVRKKLTKKNL